MAETKGHKWAKTIPSLFLSSPLLSFQLLSSLAYLMVRSYTSKLILNQLEFSYFKLVQGGNLNFQLDFSLKFNNVYDLK